MIRYNRALDGLRALSVIAVVLYHAGAIGGGWIGVEVFFVISGYLITALLLAEHDRTGTISLLAFWRRRARRLLPGIVLLACIAAIYFAWYSESRPSTTATRDMVGLLTYSSNWTTITGNGYWETFNSPSPLRHAWSLAVEEQFYLVFPVMAAWLIRRGSFRTAIYALTIAAAVWQFAASRVLSVDRVYLGTDTRVVGLFAGASLAAYCAARDRSVPDDTTLRTRRRGGASLVGVVALAGLGVAAVMLNDAGEATFAGPFQLVVLASVAMIASLHQPQRQPDTVERTATVAGRALGVEPLVLVGRWSYGIYLIHWPILIALEPATPEHPWLTAALVLAMSVPLAAGSYHLIEQPIRRHGLRAFGGNPMPAVLGATGAAAAVVALVVASATNAPAPPTVDDIAARPVPTTPGPSSAAPTIATTTLATPSTIAEQPGASAPSTTDSPVIYSSTEEVTGRVPSTLPPADGTQPLDPDASPFDRVARPDGRPFRLYVVGDSVGDSIDRMLQPLSADLDIEVFSRAVPSCGYERGPQQYFNQDFVPEACAGVIEQWDTDVATFRPDAVLVAYGGWWGWFHDGAVRTQCEPELADHVRSLYDQALTDLGSSGAPVFFMSPPDWNGDPVGPDGIPTYFNCLRDVMGSWADTANGDARIADVYSLLCTADDCSSTVNGAPTRPDGVHFHGDAAPAVMTALMGEITDPPASGWPDFGEIVLPER